MSTRLTSASGVLRISPVKNPYGLSYQDHIKSFWKWILSLPKENNPWGDRTGDIGTSAQGSVSPVFYLGGNGGGKSKRTYRVPIGKGILIPLMVVEVSEKDFPRKTVKELRQIAKKDQDSVTDLYLEIGSKKYQFKDLRKFRKSTGAFSVTFPQNGIFGATGGIAKAVADGYYIITTPLPKGTHTVHYRSKLECNGPGCLQSKPFLQDIRCTIISQ